MTDGTDRSLWLLLPRQIRELPADLAAVVFVVLCTCVSVLPVVGETPLRLVVGLPFLLFAPGYALVAALFPEQPTESDDEEDTSDSASPAGRDVSGITGIERVALSFGLSIAIVPLVGLVLNFTPWGIRLAPILVGISGVTLTLVAFAVRRRHALPEPERFRVPYPAWLASGRSELFDPESRLDGVLNVLLVVSLLLAVSAVGYAVLVPPEGEEFTEFYLLTESEDGELVAADYPQEFEIGESKPVVVGVDNNEGEQTSYSVVVQLQVVNQQNNETTVRRREELDRFSTPPIADNGTWRRTHEIQPTIAGENLQVQYLLYRGDVPETPTRENAYRTLHLWVDVTG